MLRQLIKKEILEHLMSLRFAIACVLCLVVILCSIFVRGRDYSQVMDDYQQESAMAALTEARLALAQATFAFQTARAELTKTTTIDL